MRNIFAIMGGSGIYDIAGARILKEHNITTPFGKPSDVILEIDIDGNEFFFLSRHGKGHMVSPAEINYQANIYALKSLGVDFIISMSAVGSLDDKFKPTDMVLPDQFIDRTMGMRKKTFFSDGVVGHTSMAYPINKTLQDKLTLACEKSGVVTHENGTYVCIEGPQFSTRAESLLYKSWGASIIGMTNIPEAYLAKEAGMAYATIAMVTDFDSWKGEHCTLEKIMEVMNENHTSFHKILKNLLPIMNSGKIEFEKENQYVVVSDQSNLSKRNREILDVVLS